MRLTCNWNYPCHEQLLCASDRCAHESLDAGRRSAVEEWIGSCPQGVTVGLEALHAQTTCPGSCGSAFAALPRPPMLAALPHEEQKGCQDAQHTHCCAHCGRQITDIRMEMIEATVMRRFLLIVTSGLRQQPQDNRKS